MAIDAYKHFAFDYPRFYRMDNLSKLDGSRQRYFYRMAVLKFIQPEDVGIVLANKSSSLDTDIKYFESTKAIPSPALFVYTLPNIVMGEISIRHQLKGENALFVSDRFDAGFISEYVQELFSRRCSKNAVFAVGLNFFGNDIDVALYLVEKSKMETLFPFTEENINKYIS